MKRYDIELFVKSTLQEYTLVPEGTAWPQLLDQLQKQDQKRDQKIFFRKAVLLIAIFLAGFGSVRNKSIQDLDISQIENRKTNIPTADIEIENGNKVTIITGSNASTNKTDHVVMKDQAPQHDGLSGEIKSASLDEVLTANKSSPEEFNLRPSIKVTDAEIESLLRKARLNIDHKRILRKQQEILPAREFLVDAADIEEELEPEGNVAFNNYLREFLKIKSAFAN